MQVETSYTLVSEIPREGRYWIDTPGIVVLPGGDYLAAVPVGTRDDMQHGWNARFLRSSDRGGTWTVVSEGPYSDVIPFVVNGSLFAFVQAHMDPENLFMGDIVLVRSDDGGSTWSEPVTLSFRQYSALPGGQCKFFVKCDAPSRLFWMASNIPTDSQELVHDWERIRGEKHFQGGPGNERRILMLSYSVDALNWFQAGCIAMSTNPCRSFMYPSFDIDGDDIVLISRSAINARDQHDADSATFHRVSNFREVAMNLYPDR